MTGKVLLLYCFCGTFYFPVLVRNYENIALRKSAWQQYTHSSYNADLAVDGFKSDLSIGGGQCAAFGYDHTEAEWRVDLGEILNINHILIFYATENRKWDENNRFTQAFLGYSVYMSNTTNRYDGVLCFKDINYTRATIPNPANITCPYHGRYVIYYNNRTHPPYPAGYSPYVYNDLCEVEVYGCPPYGGYGEGCSKPCPQNCQRGRCNAKTGMCFGCVDGYIGHSCNLKCGTNTYGHDCKEPCGKCIMNEQCYHVNGSCLNGCERGYQGIRCNEACSEGYYGYNCNNTCKKACFRRNGTCDIFTGVCLEVTKDQIYDKVVMAGVPVAVGIVVVVVVVIVIKRRCFSKLNACFGHFSGRDSCESGGLNTSHKPLKMNPNRDLGTEMGMEGEFELIGLSERLEHSQNPTNHLSTLRSVGPEISNGNNLGDKNSYLSMRIDNRNFSSIDFEKTKKILVKKPKRNISNIIAKANVHKTYENTKFNDKIGSIPDSEPIKFSEITKTKHYQNTFSTPGNDDTRNDDVQDEINEDSYEPMCMNGGNMMGIPSLEINENIAEKGKNKD